MKILRLDLLAFGHFTDMKLDLAAGDCGFHLIYGPNEAGKSSALEAIGQLFFGIDERSPYDFVHPKSKLRLGARIRRRDGRELDFIRHKARKVALTTSDGVTPLPATELETFLDGLDEARFKRQFRINHKEVLNATQEFADGKNLGELMFAAGMGNIAGIQKVQNQLQSAADELYLQAGRKPKINKALTDLRDYDREIKDGSLSSGEYVRLEEELSRVQQERSRVELEKNQLVRQLNEKTRSLAALKILPRQRQLAAELAACGDVRLLPEDFGLRSRAAIQELRLAEQKTEGLRQELRQLDDQLTGLAIPEAILSHADDIEQMQEQLGIYKKAQSDRPRLLGHMQQAEHTSKEILRNLGHPDNLEEVERFRLKADQQIRIQKLGNEHIAIVQSLDQTKNNINRLRARLAEIDRQLSEASPTADVTELRSILQLIQNEGSLEKQRDELNSELLLKKDSVQKAHARMTLWNGDLDRIETTRFPQLETVDRFEKELAEISSSQKLYEKQLKTVEYEIGDIQSQLSRFRAEGDVPTEADLESARKHRQSGWQLVRQAWKEGQLDSEREAAFIAGDGKHVELADAYEWSVEKTDQIADRLRREAERIAQLVNLQNSLVKQTERRDQLAAQLSECCQMHDDWKKKWQTVWAPLDVTPLAPIEMRGWLNRTNEIARQVGELNSLANQMGSLSARINGHRSILIDSMSKIGLQWPDNSILALLVSYAREAVDHADTAERNRNQLNRDRSKLISDLGEAEVELELATKKNSEWTSAWSETVMSLGLPSDASPEQANHFVNEIKGLFEKLSDAHGNRQRIKGIDRDSNQFGEFLKKIVERVSPQLGSLDFDDACQQLKQQLKSAHSVKQEFDDASNRRKKAALSLNQSDQALERCRAQVELICSEAGVASDGELYNAEQSSTKRRQLESESNTVNQRMSELCGGQPLSEFIVHLELLNADMLEMEVAQLRATQDDLGKQILNLAELIGSKRNQLGELRKAAGAVAKAADRASLIAETHSQFEQLVRLKLASIVLQESVERYRKKNQNTILARAGQLFSRLTCRSFQNIRVETDESELPTLYGFRPNSKEPVSIEGLSDGSRDQLYLALRIASMEEHMQNHEPMPLIVDDILLNFDDNRSTAALQVLAELSNKTQVIAFTHHKHLVELARQNIEGSCLFIHDLR